MYRAIQNSKRRRLLHNTRSVYSCRENEAAARLFQKKVVQYSWLFATAQQRKSTVNESNTDSPLAAFSTAVAAAGILKNRDEKKSIWVTQEHQGVWKHESYIHVGSFRQQSYFSMAGRDT